MEVVAYNDGTRTWKRNVGGYVQIDHIQTTPTSALQAGVRSYFYKDHLGSISAITDANGKVKDILAFDPWGARRKVDRSTYALNVNRTGVWANSAMLATSAIAEYGKANKNAVTQRGFTGHEMVDEAGIIHMNGRIYDASIGRFLQADPNIDGATEVAGFNRYSYVKNNPLNAVISSGDRAYLPSFVDIDSDSDFDVFIGFIDYDVANSFGILYYENKGTSLIANFQQQTGENNPFASFNELYPQPIFVDIDSDNDMDVFIGKGNGTFDYYENTTELLGLKVNNTFLKATKMYPNPATTELTFESFEKDVEIRIFSLSGIQVYKGIISEKNDKIDVSAIPSGIYVVVLNDGMTKISKKLVIAK